MEDLKKVRVTFPDGHVEEATLSPGTACDPNKIAVRLNRPVTTDGIFLKEHVEIL